MLCKLRSYNMYRAEKFGKELTWTDRAIMVRSKLHSHSEFQFSERYGRISFSETMQDNANCCRFKMIDYAKNIERWDTVVIPMTDAQEDAAYLKAKELEGTPYDLLGLLSFINEHTTIIHPAKDKMWCTECCVTLILPAHPTLPLTPDQSHPTMADCICRWFFAEKEMPLPEPCSEPMITIASNIDSTVITIPKEQTR